MFYPHTIKGKPFLRLDKVSEPVIPEIPGPNFTINTALTDVGTTDPDQFQLPLIPSLGYLAEIDWGDGSQTSITNGIDPVIHNYDSSGIYDITITGIFPAMAFNGGGDAIKMIDWKVWNDIALTEGSFDGCTNLVFTSTDVFNLLGTSLKNSFKNCQLVASVFGLDTLAVDSVTDMEGTFEGCSLFNQNITGWDVSSVTTFASTFSGCLVFNQSVGIWNVSSNVIDTTNMFRDCELFNQDLNTWDMSNVDKAVFMFANATIFNGNVTAWDMGNMVDFAGMFINAQAFNQNIGGWDVGNVISCGGLFLGATSFNQNLNTWDTSSFGTLEFMFQGATSYNQPMSNWVTNNVQEMQYAFDGAIAFNQDISNFNVALVETMEGMLDNCGMDTTNYDLFLVSCQSQLVQSNVPLGAIGLTYSTAGAGGSARSFLVVVRSWIIIGDTPI